MSVKDGTISFSHPREFSGASEAEFAQVLEHELATLKTLRGGAGDVYGTGVGSVYDYARQMQLAGLAFSGGGIRSATFNLGIIQALASTGLLSKFDYLSTVSGGGYIGGWLSALLHRKASQDGERVTREDVERFQPCLKTHPPQDGACGTAPQTVGFDPVEHLAVRYLRRYSNYLSPRLGLSGDMLAAIAIFLRNFTLIQITLISLVASLLILAHLLGLSSRALALDLPQVPAWPFLGGALALLWSVVFAGRLLAERQIHEVKAGRTTRRVILGVLAPSLLAAWWLPVAAVLRPDWLPTEAAGAWTAAVWVLTGGLAYGLAWALGYVTARAFKATPGEARASRSTVATRLALVVAALFAGALLGLLLYWVACAIVTRSSAAPLEPWHAVAYGPPLFLLGLMFVVTLHIGAARRSFDEAEREWLARLGGFVMLAAGGWALLFTLVLYSPPFVHWLAGGGLAALAAWAGGSGVGAWFARSPATGGGTGGSRWKEIVTRIAPWLFLAGLAVIVAHLTHHALLEFLTEDGHLPPPDSSFAIAAAAGLQQLHALPWTGTALACAGTLVAFLLLAWRLDINLFSLHAMYCSRLARAYLGASRAGDRSANPFTGFDPKDDLPFSALARQRPIPIVNTSINMTGGDDLAWQTRRAASFAFTPSWAGYETRSTQGTRLGKYRPTKQYAKDRKLGTLMAISGEAASPNMGYHTSSAVAALMTAFNLRLGRWCGNPSPDPKRRCAQDIWKEESPWFAAKPIFAELSGSATAGADWINLTDGGHFENLGVYELVRRRCSLIVVTDAGCDPKYQYEDLANLLRKCWTDLGVNICFADFKPMYLKEGKRTLKAHFAIGRIQYYDGRPDGALIYLKNSLTGDEWPDIRQYADTHPDFPHETTADQFFDENQFEAYRHLGFKVAAKMVSALKRQLGENPRGVPIARIVEKLAPPPAPGVHPCSARDPAWG